MGDSGSNSSLLLVTQGSHVLSLYTQPLRNLPVKSEGKIIVWNDGSLSQLVEDFTNLTDITNALLHFKREALDDELEEMYTSAAARGVGTEQKLVSTNAEKPITSFGKDFIVSLIDDALEVLKKEVLQLASAAIPDDLMDKASAALTDVLGEKDSAKLAKTLAENASAKLTEALAEKDSAKLTKALAEKDSAKPTIDLETASLKLAEDLAGKALDVLIKHGNGKSNN